VLGLLGGVWPADELFDVVDVNGITTGGEGSVDLDDVNRDVLTLNVAVRGAWPGAAASSRLAG
jgi:hypothetical protein